MDLRETFGDLDVYLFDQLLRGRVPRGSRVVDVGCGEGRNLHYLMRRGDAVAGLDPDGERIARLRRHAANLGVEAPETRFRVETAEATTFPARSFDFAILNAVLHFAGDTAQWEAIVDATWRLLDAGGILFARLGTTIGVEHLATPVGDGRSRLPGGTTWFLVDQEHLLATTRRLGGELLDPLKTTVVQDLRAMTTWVVRKPEGATP